MKTKEARNFCCPRIPTAGNGSTGNIWYIGDECGQKLGGAKPGMSHCYRLYGLDRGFISEPNAAAAVDLQIDEARHDELVGKVYASGIGWDIG
jgi:hypothetical protein